MTVGELKAALDDYGDHLPVVIVIDKGEQDVVYRDFYVDTRSIDNLPAVDLTVTL